MLPQELEFLLDSNVITQNFFNQIVSKLPDRYKEGSSPIDFASLSPVAPVSVPQVAPTLDTYSSQPTSQNSEYCEAIYDYNAQQSEDISLRKGDKITVIAKLSQDWWKGEANGKVGMFPSNYVKPSFRQSSPAPSYNQEYQSSSNSPHFPQQQQLYAPQAQQQQFYYQSPQPQQQQLQPQPQAQQVVVQQDQQQHHNGSAAFKRFGSKLGNAAIFGAGATIGSDLVNSIF
ncbi:hypothetical protein WICMUC_000354 [Wickerhamomyces mucosus]|uniref:SH3 domain-containing protein n=1 Tax=Wickerhamomyces mucosus TaxID=1378264 RepID=A0A9P8PY21_9ASCO|nr:hypothetical protein WICMUC_000354 [Wickerhamomyces mucosus]